MFTCPNCLQSFLFETTPCLGCAASALKRQKGQRARERRARYDPEGRVIDAEFWQRQQQYRGCPCCGKSWHQAGVVARDHIIPVSRGGPNQASNVQPLCQPCNLWKLDAVIYFEPEPAFAGRAAALPERLHPVAVRLGLLETPEAQPQQLSLEPVVAEPSTWSYPQATSVQLEQRTLALTRAALTSSPLP